ncbi:MAG: T9SS type A sorting domain-containing protein [Saprospiraceae bacterium]|nr:T9SS type A sorting domain-containing protein [Saprospiraceae bacterium]
MFKFFKVALFMLFGLQTTFAQVELAGSIGIGAAPQNNDPICAIPNFLENFQLSGYYAGELIPDFNLFNLAGEELIMSDLLDEGKPVLLIAGNYTCPVFRGKVPVINQIVQDFSNELQVVIIYGVEAHPIIDISPYYGYINTTTANENMGVLFQQPKTYGERKTMVQTMLTEMNILAPVYIDGPCNNWWSNFGPAPNNAYLIDTDGIILSKHAWFDKYPDDIFCDLSNFLGLETDCQPVQSNGDFLFQLTDSQLGTGPAGSTVHVSGLLTNLSDDGVEIEIIRLEEELPEGWSTSICTDVCYPASQTETVLYLEAGESLDYTNYFYTSEEPGSGFVKIGFRNVNNSQNQYLQFMSAETYTTTASTEQPASESFLALFPNPAKYGTPIQVTFPKGLEALNGSMEFYDSRGTLLKQKTISGSGTTISDPDFAPGIYWYRCQLSNGSTQSGCFMVQ